VYEPLVWVSGVVVLLGVVLEIVSDRRAFQDKRERALKKWGERLLILGLGGEIVFGIATSVLSGLIIAKMNLETAKANERTAKLQALLVPRRLTDEQKSEIAAKLSKYSRLPVDVFVLDQEDRSTMDEALNFGKDIAEALGRSMDVSGHAAGIGCQPWPVVGVIVEAPQDLSRDRYAAGDILESLKSLNVGVLPYVSPIRIPPCAAFSGRPATTAKPSNRIGWAKIIVIIGKKPTPILK
jgi:hypothetical protein